MLPPSIHLKMSSPKINSSLTCLLGLYISFFVANMPFYFDVCFIIYKNIFIYDYIFKSLKFLKTSSRYFDITKYTRV